MGGWLVQVFLMAATELATKQPLDGTVLVLGVRRF